MFGKAQTAMKATTIPPITTANAVRRILDRG
jgi:hypothetical protein